MSTFPIRCFTCGKLISNKFKEYQSRIEQGEEPWKILDDLGFERWCCRRMFMTHGTSQLEEYQLMYTCSKDRIERVGLKESSFSKSQDDAKGNVSDRSDNDE